MMFHFPKRTFTTSGVFIYIIYIHIFPGFGRSKYIVFLSESVIDLFTMYIYISWWWFNQFHVGKTIINQPFGKGLYHLFMVIGGIVHYCFIQITFHDQWSFQDPKMEVR